MCANGNPAEPQAAVEAAPDNGEEHYVQMPLTDVLHKHGRDIDYAHAKLREHEVGLAIVRNDVSHLRGELSGLRDDIAGVRDTGRQARDISQKTLSTLHESTLKEAERITQQTEEIKRQTIANERLDRRIGQVFVIGGVVFALLSLVLGLIFSRFPAWLQGLKPFP